MAINSKEQLPHTTHRSQIATCPAHFQNTSEVNIVSDLPRTHTQETKSPLAVDDINERRKKWKELMVENISNPNSPLYMAKENELKRLEELGSVDRERVFRVVDKHGSIALHWAAGAGNIEVCKYLVHTIGIPVDSRNKNQRTPFHFACRAGHLEAAKWLVEAGADPAAVMNDGSSGLMWAVWQGQTAICDWLVTDLGLTLHALNHHTCSALHWAAAGGQLEMCKWLAGKGVDFKVINASGHGALNKAAWKGHGDVCEYLLHEHDLGWQLRLVDAEGRTVADLARLAGHISLADRLDRYAATMANDTCMNGSR